MNDDTMLPDDDRDRAWAHRIGRRLEDGTPLHDAADADDHALADALFAFKHQVNADEVPAGVSERIWARLDIHLHAGPAAPRPSLRLVRPAWLAAAAIILLLIAVGWWLWPATTAPVLLAEAGNEAATYTTPDGSTITLRPHSELYALNDTETHLRLAGEAFFDITRDTTRTFQVEANEARVSVLGTAFDLSGWGEATVVYLVEGRVRFEHLPTSEAVILEPGQRSTLTPDGQLTAPEASPEDEYVDWMQGAIQFEEQSLREVLAELSQHYNLTFDIPDPMLDETLSGRFLLSDPGQSLNDLSVVLGGRFVQVDANTYRYEGE